jgi:predicted hotdog family 3-hydroxylacyl-ACP dehydratase
MNAIIEVPSGSAYFAGHFPGRPILPGVAALAMVHVALSREAGHAVPIRAIAFARLRQLVVPGDRLELMAREPEVAREPEAARLRFDLKRAGILVANGEFILGPTPAPRSATALHAAATPAAGIPPLDDLLPHRPPMRLLTSILRESAHGLTCAAQIPGTCALVAGGSAPALACIEAAAQAAAAWEAVQRWRKSGAASSRIGYLVALREIAFFTERIPADSDLLVSVSLEACAPPLTHYGIEVCLEGMPVTRGTIATFLAP